MNSFYLPLSISLSSPTPIFTSFFFYILRWWGISPSVKARHHHLCTDRFSSTHPVSSRLASIISTRFSIFELYLPPSSFFHVCNLFYVTLQPHLPQFPALHIHETLGSFIHETLVLSLWLEYFFSVLHPGKLLLILQDSNWVPYGCSFPCRLSWLP